MAMPALVSEMEEPVEEQIARLEVHVEHIRSDVSEMKTDIRRLNDKVDAVDQKLTDKIDGVDQKLTSKIDAVEKKLTDKMDAVDQKLTSKIDAVEGKLTDKMDAVDQKLTGKIDTIMEVLTSLKVGHALDRVWWLLICAAMLGVMAHGFKWI